MVYAEDYFRLYESNPFNPQTNKISGFPVTSENPNKYYSEYSSKVGMANPAAVYCQGLGYAYKIIDEANGQKGMCVFPDGSQCEEWQFLEGRCGQKYSYCALNGHDITTKYDGNNSISPVYSVCVNKKDRKELDSVSMMFRLTEKSVGTESLTQEPLSNVSEEKALAQSVPSLPSQFDWRDAIRNGVNGDWTTGAKDQGVCGSCWAFSAVGVAESAYELYKNNSTLNPDFSEEYLVSDCLRNNNCCGGWPDVAHAYIRDQGIPDDGCMQYVSGTCTGCNNEDPFLCDNVCTFSQEQPVERNAPFSCANTQCQNRCTDWQNRTKRTDYMNYVKDKGRSEIKEDLIKYGPLSAVMLFGSSNGYWDPLGWVYRCWNTNNRKNHGVIIVGYNDIIGYWIVKNSWGTGFPVDNSIPGYDGPDTQGFFNVAYGDCAIETEISYSSGFNGLTTWSGMDIRNDTTGFHDGSNADVETFSSPQAPANSFAVSCVSKSATDEKQDWYGEDDIVGIMMNNNQCTVTANDVEGGFEQKRETGVVAIPRTYNANPPQITLTNWDVRNSSNHDGTDASTENFTNNNLCPSGYFPISCSSNSANREREDWYGEDDIIGINITSGSSPKCQITAYDKVGDDEQKRMVATVCYPQQPTIVWGNWEIRDDNTHDGADSRIETFFGPDCPAGYFPVSCLSESANKEREDWYGEDAIQSIIVSGYGCIVTARDENGNGEHKRRVGTLCLPKCAGDADGDGKINMRDVALIIRNFNKPLSACPSCDVNGDGTINMRDTALAIANFNKNCS